MNNPDTAAAGPVAGVIVLILVGIGFYGMLDAGFRQGRRSGYCEATCDVIGGEKPMFRLDSNGACICIVEGQDWPAPTGR